MTTAQILRALLDIFVPLIAGVALLAYLFAWSSEGKPVLPADEEGEDDAGW